ncbi:dephospho-CoA kinase [Christiangramia forsetii]|uniref:Dephospho-CoA kinase n=2 Tax=Christiangramia forsetii TaxID=411153 RepID=A0LZ39_CHRFK|nr:dephospho-CoA kinase [Christiangramia forsetii]GGG37367.1 dephospho-CoA kinase [Christiangramia forsetii]CAL65634.1 dephospho-CoA kinase [Christiangramia forsetii KT0803]
MKIVGLTGGIGSGKTTVAGFFKELNIPVYIADEAGKRLMNTSSEIRKKIIAFFGESAYRGDHPDRKFIASKVFNDKEQLSKLNNIIHPAVEADFKNWLETQSSEYVIYEAAILFETGGYEKCDFNILVTAPKEIRIQRLQKRDDSSVKEIEERMDNQWSDERKSQMADFLINNEELAETKLQVEHIHDEILKAGKNC